MGQIPKTINYMVAAQLLNVHEKTILRRFKIANAGVTPNVSVAALKAAFNIEQSYLVDFFNKKDHAVRTGDALKYIGLTYDRHHTLWAGLMKPVAKWRGATRYSARRLGMMSPPPQPMQNEVGMVVS